MDFQHGLGVPALLQADGFRTTGSSMNATKAYVLTYLATLVAFLLLDTLWLTQMAAGLFKAELGDLLRPAPLLSAAILFYLIYALAIQILAVHPALAARSGMAAAGYGALLGLASYGAFDLTNLAILKAWTPTLAALDMTWGAAGSALSAVAGYLTASYLRERR
jgi:uncharacterized membrane protein